jgi:hypothetical protein
MIAAAIPPQQNILGNSIISVQGIALYITQAEHLLDGKDPSSTNPIHNRQRSYTIKRQMLCHYEFRKFFIGGDAVPFGTQS